MRIDQGLNPRGPTHPRLGPDGLHPVGEARDEADVFLHMLLANPTSRDDAPGRERNGRPEDRLSHEDALGMMAERPVPEVRSDLLALVDYVDSMPTVAFCPMLAVITRKIAEAQMFKLRSADGGATILVTAMDGNAVDPICSFVGYLGAKAYSPNTALA